MSKVKLAFTALTVVLTSFAGAQTPAKKPMTREEAEKVFAKAKLAHQLINEGYLAQEEGKIELAENLFLQALRENPENISPTLPLALMYDKQKRYVEARKMFKVALTTKNKAWSAQVDPRYLTRFGELSLEQGFPEGARQAFLKATKRGPDPLYHPVFQPRDQRMESIRSAAHLAVAYELGTHAEQYEGIEEVLFALKLTPTWWVAEYHLSRLYLMTNQIQKSLDHLDKAQHLAPTTEQHYIQERRKMVIP